MGRKGTPQLEKAPWLWLCIVPVPPPRGQTSTAWNFQKSQAQAVAADDDQFWLGVSDPVKGRRTRSAADRVAALVRHGSAPEDANSVLTRSMIESVWDAFTSTRGDRFPAAAPAHLLRFLLSHRGGIAFVREAQGPDTGDYDEELNRHIREAAANQPSGVSVARVTHLFSDDEPDEGQPDGGGEGGVREPRRPMPGSPPVSAAAEPDADRS